VFEYRGKEALPKKGDKINAMLKLIYPIEWDSEKYKTHSEYIASVSLENIDFTKNQRTGKNHIIPSFELNSGKTAKDLCEEYNQRMEEFWENWKKRTDVQ
jgi:hypothetical protein